MRIEMLPNPSAAIVYQLAHQISTSLFGPEAVNFQRSANGTSRKYAECRLSADIAVVPESQGSSLSEPKETFRLLVLSGIR
jgi:hypothetical protein